MGEPDGFREFVAVRSRTLLRIAWLLTGDWHTAQDLVQTSLLKTWPRWNGLSRRDEPELYVRRVMINTYASWWRRRWNSEVPTGVLTDQPGPTDAYADADLRAALLPALAQLPRRQRATIVLRYFDDLTEAQTADVLGCSVGTVKSQASKALASLRLSPTLASLIPEEVTR